MVYFFPPNILFCYSNFILWKLQVFCVSESTLAWTWNNQTRNLCIELVTKYILTVFFSFRIPGWSSELQKIPEYLWGLILFLKSWILLTKSFIVLPVSHCVTVCSKVCLLQLLLIVIIKKYQNDPGINKHTRFSKNINLSFKEILWIWAFT